MLPTRHGMYERVLRWRGSDLFWKLKKNIPGEIFRLSLN